MHINSTSLDVLFKSSISQNSMNSPFSVSIETGAVAATGGRCFLRLRGVDPDGKQAAAAPKRVCPTHRNFFQLITIDNVNIWQI